MKVKLYSMLALFCALVISATGIRADSQPLSFSVRHDHWAGHCDGVLRIGQDGITYDSPNREHARTWSFVDVHQVEILSRTKLIVHTYGKPKAFEFILREGELNDTAYRILAERIDRGLASRVLFSASEFRFQLPAKHRHRVGGCQGVLRIGSAEIVYETDDPKHNRIWRIRDIRSFGTAHAHDLRLTTESETFTFDLKEALQQDAYDFLWQQIYGPKFAPWGRAP